MSSNARYPSQFEISRLEAGGDPPYLDVDEVRHRYEVGQSIRVLSPEDPPTWFLLVAPKRYRFTLTYYTASGTPVRTVTWEQDGEGLLCRRTIDLFYPDGDPSGTVPSIEVVTVTQQVSADGVVDVTLSSPIDDDEYRQAAGVSVEAFRSSVPLFGEWQPLLDASTPASLVRFGLDSIDAAIAYAEKCASQGAVREDDSNQASEGWRVSASDRDVMRAIDAIIDDDPVPGGIPVFTRGAVQVVPLAAQTNSRASAQDSHEEQRRMTVLAAEIRDACEQREGRAISVDLDYDGADSLGSYISALKSAGATAAQWWEFRQTHGVALVWSGDTPTGTLSLALHVVPVSWVSARQATAAIGGIDLEWSETDVTGWQAAPQPTDPTL